MSQLRNDVTSGHGALTQITDVILFITRRQFSLLAAIFPPKSCSLLHVHNTCNETSHHLDYYYYFHYQLDFIFSTLFKRISCVMQSPNLATKTVANLLISLIYV